MTSSPVTMNLYRQTLALLLVGTFITAECAYAALRRPVEQRIDAPRTQMTVSEARKALTESLGHLRFIKSVREVKFNRHRVTFVGSLDHDDLSAFANGQSVHCSVPFAEMKNLSVDSISKLWWFVQVNGKDMGLGRSRLRLVQGDENIGEIAAANFENESAAIKFVDAVLTLKAAALAPDTEETDFAAFTVSAKTWLAATPKPEMPDDARAYKALAEDAFERKDFTTALDAFCKALDKYPMWPSGRYNAALLAAEAEDYELAAKHMRRYLVLSPDAKDAVAAKDKLLLWQLKAKQ